MGKVSPIEKAVKPIVITDTETGYTYTLEFNRAVITRAEKSGFVFSEEKMDESPMSTILDLWYWSFQMHHRNMSKDKTEEILEQMGGITKPVIERLAELYASPFNSLIGDDEVNEKNSRMTIQL